MEATAEAAAVVAMAVAAAATSPAAEMRWVNNDCLLRSAAHRQRSAL